METAHVLHCYDEPPAEVFGAWLDSERLAHWLFGPKVRDERIVALETDPRVGGHFRFAVERNGTQVDYTGEYLEIGAPARLVFSWGVGAAPRSRVTVAIAPFGGGSQLELKHALTPESAPRVDAIRAGWSRALDALAHELAEA